MGLYKEIVAKCDICGRSERFDNAKNIAEAEKVGLEKGWFIKRKATSVSFVVCQVCRKEISGN